MQAFTHLALLALLLVLSATPVPSTPPTAANQSTTPTPSTPTAATTATTTTPASAPSATPATTITGTESNSSGTVPSVTSNNVTSPETSNPGADARAANQSSTPTPSTPTAANQSTTPTHSSSTAATANNTTMPTPAPSISTATPANTTTTPASAPSATLATTITGTESNSSGTVPSVTSNNVTSPETSNPGTDARESCRKGSCAAGAYCVNLYDSYFCLCADGNYYTPNGCKRGKVFPGKIQANVADTSDLENETSPAYEKLHQEVTKFFEDVFNSTDYGQTVIQRVRIAAAARYETRAGGTAVTVTVVNLFAESTKENETTISETIGKAISTNSSRFTEYTTEDRCDFYGCVKESGQDCSDIFQCKCKPGLMRPNAQSLSCVAVGPSCPDACGAEQHMQCVVKGGAPDCECLPGYEKDAQKKCRACAFGYGGVNCADNFQLILTIVGTIAGAIILGMLAALIFIRSKKTKDTEEQNLMENDFQNLRLQQMPGFIYPQEGSIFPKVTATFPKESSYQNPYANPRGMARPDY